MNLPAGPTRLLVSVRCATEAEVALCAGADLIDVKEPRSGPLGAATPHVVDRVLRAVRRRVPVSVALGELGEATGRRDQGHRPLARLSRDALAGLHYAKIGLAGEATRADWTQRWRTALGRLPPGVAGVAVVYADWQRAAAPPPMRVVTEAVTLDCPAVLVDTYDKTAGSLLDHWDLERLDAFVRTVRDSGRIVVVGGSLAANTLPAVLGLQPDYVAVRGAACGAGRESAVRADRVAELAGILRAAGVRRRPDA